MTSVYFMMTPCNTYWYQISTPKRVPVSSLIAPLLEVFSFVLLSRRDIRAVLPIPLFFLTFLLSFSFYLLSFPQNAKAHQIHTDTCTPKKNLPPQQQNAFCLAGSYPATHTRLWLRGPFGPLPPTPLGAPEPSVTHDRAFACGPDHHLGLPPLFPRGLPAHLEGGRHVCHPDPAPARIYRFGVGVVGFCDGGP